LEEVGAGNRRGVQSASDRVELETAPPTACRSLYRQLEGRPCRIAFKLMVREAVGFTFVTNRRAVFSTDTRKFGKF